MWKIKGLWVGNLPSGPVGTSIIRIQIDLKAQNYDNLIIVPADKRKNIIDIEKHMEEAQELIEQMELEVRELKSAVRPKYRTRLDSYRAELGRLSVEFVNAKQQGADTLAQETYYTEPFTMRDEQKQRLLDNSERVERTGTQLKTGYRVLLETEEIGIGVLRDLQGQRETIEKSRSRVSLSGMFVA